MWKSGRVFFCVRLELTELTQKLETLEKLKCSLTNKTKNWLLEYFYDTRNYYNCI